MNKFKLVVIFKKNWGRRRPCLYADIPVHVLHVPAGNEGGPGGFTNPLKDEEGEEKKEDDDDVVKMEGKRRGEVDIQDSLGGAGGHIGQILLGPSCHFCSYCFKVLTGKNKLNNHIVYIYKIQTA